MAILVDRHSRVVIQGITGREASMVTALMLHYGTPVIAGITPGRGGQRVESMYRAYPDYDRRGDQQWPF